MMRNLYKAVTVLLTLSLLSSTGFAQDPNTDLIKKLYTKIGQAVSVGSNDPTTGETFLVLANPGILLDPNLNYNNPTERARFARTIDKVLDPKWIYGTRNYTVFDVYNRILQDHEAAEVQPTQQQREIYRRACDVIFTDCDQPQPGNYSDAWKRYSEALNKLIVLSKQAEDYRKNNQTEDLPPQLTAELQAATDNLELIGNRTSIEAARATINTYEHIDPNAWWGELAGRFRANSEMIGAANRFGNLTLYPSYPVWLDMNRSWTNMVLTQSELEQTTTNSHTHVGGGGGFSVGLWSVGADYENTENRHYYEFKGRNYSISMEIMRANIERPWMDAGVFDSRAWKFLAATLYHKKKISSGANATGGVTPPSTDVMPFIPTGLLLARRVSIKADWSSDLKTSFDSHTSSGGSVGWGPFSFSGRYDSSNDSSYRKATAAGNTLSWDAPQILGFFVQVLPESPNPDPCYRFPSDPSPLPPDCADTLSLLRFDSWRPKITVTSSLALDNAKVILRSVRTFRQQRQKFRRQNLNNRPS